MGSVERRGILRLPSGAGTRLEVQRLRQQVPRANPVMMLFGMRLSDLNETGMPIHPGRLALGIPVLAYLLLHT